MEEKGTTTKKKMVEMALGRALTHTKNALAVLQRLLARESLSISTPTIQEDPDSAECKQDQN